MGHIMGGIRFWSQIFENTNIFAGAPKFARGFFPRAPGAGFPIFFSKETILFVSQLQIALPLRKRGFKSLIALDQWQYGLLIIFKSGIKQLKVN